MINSPVVIEDVLTNFDMEAITRRLHMQHHQKAAIQRLNELAQKVFELTAVARPRVAAKLCVLKTLDTERVEVGGVTLHSAHLVEKIGKLQRVFPYIVTEGNELADYGARLESPEDIAFTNMLRDAVVRRYAELLEKALLKRFDISQLSSVNPGSLPLWPLEEQRPLFQLLAPFPAQLGVELYSTCRMGPPYSISGIFFQTDTKYYNCQLCPRKDCPTRMSP